MVLVTAELVKNYADATKSCYNSQVLRRSVKSLVKGKGHAAVVPLCGQHDTRTLCGDFLKNKFSVSCLKFKQYSIRIKNHPTAIAVYHNFQVP